VTIEALEAVVQAAPGEPEIDMAEAKEVRRLITMRLAAARHNDLPAAWVRRPGSCTKSCPIQGLRPRRHRGPRTCPRVPAGLT
jgi:hypothetical protein